MNRADLTLIRGMTTAERMVAKIGTITSGQELAEFYQRRAFDRREPYPGENEALALRERELRGRG